MYNELTYKNPYPCNPHTQYLQALFLQQEYEKQSGTRLPIFEYSGIHNFIKPAPNYCEDEIMAMWVSMVSSLIQKNLQSQGHLEESLEDLKIKAIDGYLCKDSHASFVKKQAPLDINYSPELRRKIDRKLKKLKEYMEANCDDVYSLQAFIRDFPSCTFWAVERVLTNPVDFVRVCGDENGLSTFKRILKTHPHLTRLVLTHDAAFARIVSDVHSLHTFCRDFPNSSCFMIDCCFKDDNDVSHLIQDKNILEGLKTSTSFIHYFPCAASRAGNRIFTNLADFARLFPNEEVLNTFSSHFPSQAESARTIFTAIKHAYRHIQVGELSANKMRFLNGNSCGSIPLPGNGYGEGVRLEIPTN